MWCLVITLLSSFYVGSAENTAEIEINFYRDREGELQCRGNDAVVVLDVPFRVYLNYTENVYRARCDRSSAITEVLFNKIWKEPENIRVGYVSKIMQMTQVGSWSYSCEFYTRNCDANYHPVCYYYPSNVNNILYQDKGVKCSFAVEVLKPDQISAKITGYLVATPGSYSSGTHNYYFYDGKPMDFVCHKTSGGFVKLTYTTAGETISTGYQATDSVALYVKLTADVSNDTYLTCLLTNELYKSEVVIELHFIVDPANKPAIGFEINNLVLPIMKRNKDEFLYEYKYYAGELLTVEVVKDDEKYDDLTCSVEGHNIPETLDFFFKNSTQIVTGPLKFVLNEEQTNGSVSLCCTVVTRTPGKSHYISVAFKHHSPDFSPFIDGISMANVLMKYSTSTKNVIKYEYIRDKILNLTCNAGDNPTQWLYYKQAVWSSESSGDEPRRLFMLNSGRNKTIIQCRMASSLSNRNTTLELIRNKAVKISTTPFFEVTTVSMPATTTGKAGVSENVQPKENEKNLGEKPPRENPEQPKRGTQKGNVAGSGTESLQGGDAVPGPQETTGEVKEQKILEKKLSKGADVGQPIEESLKGNKERLEINSSLKHVQGSSQDSPKDDVEQTLKQHDLRQGNKKELNQDPPQNTRESVKKQTNENIEKPVEIPIQENAKGSKGESTQAGQSVEPERKSSETKIESPEQQSVGIIVDSINTPSLKNYPISTTQKNTKMNTPKQSNASTKKPNKHTTKKSAWRSTKKPIKPSVKSTKRPTVKPAGTTTAKPTVTITVKPTESTTVKPTESTTVKPTETTTVKPIETTMVKPTETTTVKITETTPRITDAVASSTEFVMLSAGESGSAVFQPTSPTEDKQGYNFGIIAAAAAVVLVSVAVIIWITVDLKKRKRKRKRNATEIDYQNLPQHNEGPMPTPAQWDSYANDATYAVPSTDLENLYSKPVPKSQRNTKLIEPTYVEARDAIKTEPTYASVQNEITYASVQNSDGPTYASVQHSDGPTYASVQNSDGPTYASVQNSDGPTYASVQKTTDDPTYAEVSKNNYQNLESMAMKGNELTYADIYKNDISSKKKPVPSAKPVYGQIMPKKPGDLKYVNLEDIKNQRENLSGKRYANMDVKNEEIEPAYCEVNVNKQ